MKNLSGNEIRALFLKYFEKNGHMIEKGASLIPHNDPTLLWINAGVAALKKYFDGSEKPMNNRIANAQKCIRTNDIENVGRTARHHTFFEMLGNFSIGDYFKKEAIHFAYEFLTGHEWIGFDKNKLYITVYKDDEEAYNIWTKELGVDPSHILKTENNYWEIGEGPSGPDTEIYYDRGPAFDKENRGEELFFNEIDNDRYIEVWNVVFSQYDAKEGVDRKDYKELPQKNIDTGMGLERLVCIVQNGETNFETDLFLPIIKEVEKMSVNKYVEPNKMAYRVIADHIRTLTFALSDGAAFSNEGRGYVLRRVLRRAVRYGKKLGIEHEFMYKLVDTVKDMYLEFYPYLESKTELVKKLIKQEEISFNSTLKNGEKLLIDELEKNKDTKKLSGETVFKLYDTYGFPKELTLEIASDAGYEIDLVGFDKAMKDQQERARSSRSDEQSMNSQDEDLMNFISDFEFLGYEKYSCSAKVLAIFKDGKLVDSVSDGADIIFDQSVFYAESGGQVADTGIIENDNFRANVVDVIKAPHKQHLHHIKIESGSVSINDVVDMRIDIEKRNKTKANHSSLHLLNSALHLILGNHINQAGSFVNEDYGRFDFTHYEKIDKEILDKIEKCVNEFIMKDSKVITEVLPIDEAKNSGAIALFDEKYGDFVRVVSIGSDSKEFCGGTHVSNTSEIGVFKILSEESIGSGIRRITTNTKLNAYEFMNNEINRLDTLAKLLKLNGTNDLEKKLLQVIDENNELKKQVQLQDEKMLNLKVDSFVSSFKKVNGLNVLLYNDDTLDSSNIKSFGEKLRNKVIDSFIFITSKKDDRLTYAAILSKKAIEKGFNANNLIKLANEISNGKGGGRNDSAQGGSKEIDKQQIILTEIEKQL